MLWQANNNIVMNRNRNRNIIISEELVAPGNVHFSGNFDKLLHAFRYSPFATCHSPHDTQRQLPPVLWRLQLVRSVLPAANYYIFSNNATWSKVTASNKSMSTLVWQVASGE